MTLRVILSTLSNDLRNARRTQVCRLLSFNERRKINDCDTISRAAHPPTNKSSRESQFFSANEVLSHSWYTRVVNRRSRYIMGSGGRGFKSEMPRTSRRIYYKARKRRKSSNYKSAVTSPALSLPGTPRHPRSTFILSGVALWRWFPLSSPLYRSVRCICTRLSPKRGTARVLFGFLEFRRRSPVYELG